MTRITTILTTILLSMVVTSGYAGQQEIDRIKAMLNKQMPSVKITAIAESSIPGLYEVVMPPKLLYVSGDAKHVISGDIINTESGDNLTMPKRDSVRAEAIDLQGENSMIVFSPKKVKHTITVFTDIDCGYCRKLHEEISDYNKLGIKVRYMSFPRAGIGSESYDKAVSVWCADNRRQAMTSAKNGKSIKNNTCDNPVASHYKLGEQIGIRGTPAIVLETGQVVPGYVPAERLFAGLEQQKKTVR